MLGKHHRYNYTCMITGNYDLNVKTMWTSVLMESVRANLDTYLRTAVIVLLGITKTKKMGSANVRFKQTNKGGTYTVLLSNCFTYRLREIERGMNYREKFYRAIYRSTYNVCV